MVVRHSAERGEGENGGRCRTRTDDLFRVKEARYQLRQSPKFLLLHNLAIAFATRPSQDWLSSG